jgi:hypothetical protein
LPKSRPFACIRSSIRNPELSALLPFFRLLASARRQGSLLATGE